MLIIRYAVTFCISNRFQQSLLLFSLNLTESSSRIARNTKNSSRTESIAIPNSKVSLTINYRSSSIEIRLVATATVTIASIHAAPVSLFPNVTRGYYNWCCLPG